MSYKEYWFGDPYLVRVYKRAYDYKRQEQNQILWLQGLYNYNAISAVMANFGASLSGKKGNAEYLKEPLDLFAKSKTDEELKIQKERQKIIDYFTQMKKSWDLTHQNNGVNKNGNS